jgi:hypothetical protein
MSPRSDNIVQMPKLRCPLGRLAAQAARGVAGRVMSARSRQTKRSTAPAKQAPLELHEFCKMVPEHSTEDYRRLVEDLKKTGRLIEAITTFEGKILDGRGRYRACAEAGIEPHFTPFQGTRSDHPKLDVQLMPLALSFEQCVEYRLPRVPADWNLISDVVEKLRRRYPDLHIEFGPW